MSQAFARLRHITATTEHPLLYGLDIETDTQTDGLDPTRSRIVAVAVVGEDVSAVFDGDEAEILRSLEQLLAELPPGVLVTWNGSRFDLPFLSDRAALTGVELGLQLAPSPYRSSWHDPLPGHDGGYAASWDLHQHLDAYFVFRSDVGASMHLSCALKPLARMVGLRPVEVDRSQLHRLTAQEMHDYVASDAHVTRELALRRWPTAQNAIDPYPIGT